MRAGRRVTVSARRLIVVALAALAFGAGPGASSAAGARGAAIARPDSLARRRADPARHAPAATDTLLLEDEPPEPRAAYGSFEAARDSLAAILRRALGSCADSASWRRGRTSFLYWDKLTLVPVTGGRAKRMWRIDPRDSEVSVPSLTVSLETSGDGCPDDQAVARALDEAGWSQNPYYGADGADGTVFAYFSREAICRVEGRWDGGDPTDSTYVPSPLRSLEMVCVPRPRETAAYRRARPR